MLLAGLMLAASTLVALSDRDAPLPLPISKEEFDPLLAGLDSVDEIMFILDTTNPGASSLQKLDAADALLRRRFIHSYSYFRADQNWVAASLRPIWDDLASPVRPDDILRFRRAACSQQALVFLEIARRLDFDHAAVDAPGHFLAGVKIDGAWWVYDANREIRVRRFPFSWLKTGDPRINAIYEPSVATLLLSGAKDGQIYLRDFNRFAAPNARMLHTVTDFLSHYAWLVLLTAWAILMLWEKGARPLPRKVIMQS